MTIVVANENDYKKLFIYVIKQFDADVRVERVPLISKIQYDYFAGHKCFIFLSLRATYCAALEILNF